MKAKLYTDGGSRGNPGPAGIGFVIIAAGKAKIEGKKFIGRATNNQAEYEALLAGVKKAVKEGVLDLDIYMDSELIVRQLLGRYRVKDRSLKILYEQRINRRRLVGRVKSLVPKTA